MKRPLRFGTRGSPLARTQTRLVQETLREHQPETDSETIIIRTTGDQWALQAETSGLPSDKGMFTKELEEALLRDQIDLAVHSLKDLPVVSHPELEILAILPRANPQDILILREPFPGWANLPIGAILATGSLRRGAQLRLIRPDLQLVDIRGNIETRLRKLRENPHWYGIILAAAGIDRLRPDLGQLTVTAIDFAIMLPAPGQGAIALQGRRGDQVTQQAVAVLHCSATKSTVQAERAFLQGLGGGCRAPVGAYAKVAAERVYLEGVYFPEPLGPGRKGQVQGLLAEAEQLGFKLAEELLRS